MNLKLLLFIALITISSFAQNKNKTIGFKENKGQIIDQKGKPNNAVKYLLNSGGLNVQLKKNGFSYDVYEAKKHPINHSHDEKKKPLPFPSKDNDKLPDYTLEYQFHRIDIDFVNSNPKVELITEEKSLDYDNYYNIPNKPKGVLMVHQYKQITYKNIYPHIDVVFSVPKDTLKTVEYNFVVHPKGKISDIQLKFSGAQTELKDNKIRMTVRFGEMEETLPASWTEDGQSKKDIAVGYTKIKKNVYGFASSGNVSEKTLIIDPVPTRLWGTFYGDHTGSAQVLSTSSISTDSFGNAYVAGSTNAQNSSYATTGAHQTTQSSSYLNGIIEKFSPNGNRLWGTYYGGQNYCGISDIKIDFQDNVIVTGTTQDPTDISTVGSYKQTLGGYQDAFLAKFNSSGVRLWATYFGGEDQDLGFAVDVDISNNIYLIGQTASTTGIAINSKFQTHLNLDPNFSNSVDGFLTKFGSTGNLIWSTYVGGETSDILNDIAVKNNFLVIGGTTYSFNNISTPGVFQELHDPITHPDGVVYKFSLDGERTWATYYGGEQIEDIYAIEIDDEDNIYIGGETASNNNITTPDSFESSNPFSYKGFLAKLNTNGKRIWGTYIGQAHIYSIVFRNNSIYLGATNFGFSYAKLTTPCSYRSNKHFERYIAKFSKDADFIWGTDIGGDSMDSPTKIALDQNNNIFASSISSENNGIADASSYQSNVLGFHNYFLMKFEESVMLGIPKIESNSPVCIGKTLELKASGGTNHLWTGPNGFTSTDQNPTISNTTTANSGEYSCLITGTGGCDDTKKIDVIIGDIEAPVPHISNLQTITGDCHSLITTIPTATDACAGSITATTSNPLSYSLPGTYTVIWDYNDGNGNISHQNQTVTISNQPFPTATSPQPFCIQQNATINDIAITGQNVKWYDVITFGNLLLNTTPLQNGFTYYASQTINGCESERIPVVVNIQNTLPPTGVATQSFCTSQNPTLSTIVVVGSSIKWYDSSTLGNLLTDTTPLVDGKTYYASQTENNCESTNRLAVTVPLISSLPSNDYDLSICDDLNDDKEYVKLEDFNSFLISNTPNYSFSYYKSLPDAENELTANKITAVSNYKLALGENKIYVRINSNTPCYAIAVLKITLLPKPIIPIQDIVPICENKSILIDAGSGADSYLWSNGKATQTITIDNPGDLSVIVTKNYNTVSCFSYKKFTVKTSNIAKITSIETQDWTDNDNTITVFVTGSGDFEYSIDGTNYQNSNQFSGVNSGEYTVQVRDKNGCGIATEEVYLLMYPKFFTPNGDGFNDTWKIKSSDSEKDLILKIFDRFGKLLKELDSSSNDWDGTYIGQTLPATDYWFVATRKNGKEYKGHFSLKR
ncbi:hypothetical protein DOS84_04985 [Flavobacterium aquariorum]|uniref:Ig-like domain-containing protein n=1 Tax=Flavobacterium aquariorum TaxID=2217670 RepID=A0A2W7TZZ4_9FLAO|nr:T9SS type B sorting domain-containing protein [Flavobacterium aquariorum]PZX94906.1 hypothetical protein DOS84_04985 [Flavobacterium aquariorum]